MSEKHNPYSPEERADACMRARDILNHPRRYAWGEPVMDWAQDTVRWCATCDALEAERDEWEAHAKQLKMTEVLDANPPDHDALAAEKIMGYQAHDFFTSWLDANGKELMPFCEWHPTTNPAQAEMVRKAMSADGWGTDMYARGDRPCQVIVYDRTRPYRTSGTAFHLELSHAIVEASLRAIGKIE